MDFCVQFFTLFVLKMWEGENKNVKGKEKPLLNFKEIAVINSCLSKSKQMNNLSKGVKIT